MVKRRANKSNISDTGVDSHRIAILVSCSVPRYFVCITGCGVEAICVSSTRLSCIYISDGKGPCPESNPSIHPSIHQPPPQVRRTGVVYR